jgi:transcriptional regulator with XRE-family HTH domain
MERHLNIPSVTKAMEDNGLNSAGLARSVGVSRQIVSRWLNGDSIPRPDKQLKLALALNLGLRDVLLTQSPANDPVIAFRKMGNRKTTMEHVEHAKGIGRMLRPLVPFLPFDRLRGPCTLKEPIPVDDYAYRQAIAREIRRVAGVGLDEVLDFRHLIKLFSQQQTVLVPVLWGTKQRHENALHIYLPDTQTTWVFLNLDVEVHDFKFWMAHELGHVWAPDLRGDDGEDFADALAATLLFPESLAESAYQHLRRARHVGSRVNRIKEIAEQHLISPITVYREIGQFAEHHQQAPIDLGKGIYGAARNLSKGYYRVSESLFDQDLTSPQRYIEVADTLFDSPFFPTLRDYLRKTSKGPGYLQSILDIPLLDAKALHAALT